MTPEEHTHTPPPVPHDTFPEDIEFAKQNIQKARDVLATADPAYQELKRLSELPEFRIAQIKETLGIPESEELWSYTLTTDPTITSPETAEEALKANNISIREWAKDILAKTPFSHESTTYDLVQLTVEQLGFPEGATTAEIYAKALSLGLDLCPAEVGPHLRLSYPGTDSKVIAMEPITDRSSGPRVFNLAEGGAWVALYANNGHAGGGWGGDSPWVFLSRKLDA